MKIVIELGDDVSREAEARIRQAVAACAQHEVDFQGDDLLVSRGDFTQVSKGEGHSDAQRLFAFVQRLATDVEPFAVDHEGRTLVPLSAGGFAAVSARA